MSGRVPSVEILVRAVLYLIGIPLAFLLASIAFAVIELVGRALVRRVRRMGRRARAALRRRRARRRERRGPATWSATLLVDADEDGDLLVPIVQVSGPGAKGGVLRVELMDERGEVRLTSEQRLPRRVLGNEVRFSPLAPPDDASVGDVLAWRWDVVVADGRREHARWSQHLCTAHRINDEAELELGPHDPVLDATESAVVRPDDDGPLTAEERLLRAIFGEGARQRV